MTEKELKHSLGRLIMPRLNVDEFGANAKYRSEIERLVRSGKARGFCIFGGAPATVRALTDSLQLLAKEHDDLPLLFSCDAEWGVPMRLREGGTEFPHARAFTKALKDATLIEEASYRIGMELLAMGIRWDFAPVADVNTNRYNPIINIRSYGETAETVIRTATLVFQGIRKSGVIACAKHFPGHGGTLADSHRDLPIITHGAQWMFTNDLPPFEALINAGIPSIMTGHVAAPSLAARYGAQGKERHLPATVSSALITGLLRNEMKFDGVVVTDSLEMGAIRKVVPRSGEAAQMAIDAGADVLLMPIDPVETHQTLWRAVERSPASREMIEASVNRVRKLVESALQSETPSVEETFQRGRTRALAQKIAEKAVKIKGDVAEFKYATEILLLSSDLDSSRVEAIKTMWESQGITIPIRIIRKNFDKNQELSEAPIVIIYDRPHGVLDGMNSESQIIRLLRQVVHRFIGERVDSAGFIFLGNPYLDQQMMSHSARCVIHTYSATEPSVKVIGNTIKNAM